MNRIDYLDIAKGIGIILVYIGHCYIGERTQTLSNVIFLFCIRNVIFFKKERISYFYIE